MTKYWHQNEKYHRVNEKVDAFLNDLFSVYEKHNMSLGHEDTHGGFIINEDCKYNREWVGYASVDILEKATPKQPLPMRPKP